MSNFKSSKVYEFDYIIEYKSLLSGKEDQSVFYLTNSKDNEYWAIIRSIDKKTYTINFYKHNSIRLFTKLNKKDFYKAETILLERPKHNYKRNYKANKKDYFKVLSDTILDQTPISRYVFKSIDVHEQKLDVEYFVQPNTSFHLPILVIGEAYKKWEKEKNIPNGIFKEMYFLNSDKTIVEAHYKLVGYQAYKKQIKVKF
ncbi:hypothetical protein [Psychroserpens ponticola]|uniref:Uncharacterized protein n=1 Tax=Psychroserpens ponticola TaxID=2932268 RepID=A0ABY7S1U1_9FLAO|nr:hypothetical protein [Psychroserpens ponticola]WCO02975.1 hypothetical protein MUN68_005655 [Psychroserpens ponticola]